MATDQEKSSRREVMLGTLVFGITYGVWEMMEDSATALTPTIGKSLLPMLEARLGLKIAGEKPADVLTEVGRIFVDELGWAKGCTVTATEKAITINLTDAMDSEQMAEMAAKGMKFFSHPVMCTGVGALTRMGVKCRPSVTADAAAKTETITFELL
jgi:hypothetical protein